MHRFPGFASVVSLVVLLAAPAAAQAGWSRPVDSPNPFANPAGSDAYGAQVEAIGGVPYVAWSDQAAGATHIRVARLNADGTGWERTGGAAPLNHDPAKPAYAPSLANVGGVPYVAWTETDGTNSEVRVSRLNAAGTAWEEVGTGASPVNHDPARNANGAKLLSVAGTPYVAWAEADTHNVYQIRVSRFDPSARQWVEVEGGTSPINHDSARSATNPAPALVNGVPHVAWSEDDATGRQVRVARLNGSDWQEIVGGNRPVNNGAGNGIAGSVVSLADVGGVPYVAWTEFATDSYEVRVARLNAAGDDWQEPVAGARPINRSPGVYAGDPVVIGVARIPVVVRTENGEVFVDRLSEDATEWKPVVGGPSPVDRVPGRAGVQTAITTIGGVPYIGWSEVDAGRSRIQVARLAPELTDPQALPVDGGAVLLARAQSFGLPANVAFDHGPGTTLASRTPAVATSSSGGIDTLAQPVGGLAAGTAHSFRAIATDGRYLFAPSATAAFTTPARVAADGGAGTGANGTSGGASVVTVTRLLVAIVDPKPRVRSGKRVSVAYLSTAPATTTLEVYKGKKRVARVASTAKAGRNKIAWNGKVGRKRAAAGRYTLKLLAAGGDGQSARDEARLTVLRKR